MFEKTSRPEQDKNWKLYSGAGNITGILEINIMQHFIIILTIRICTSVSIMLKKCYLWYIFSRKFKEVNLLGYQKGNIQYTLGNTVGE